MSAACEAAPQAAAEELEAKLIAPDELRLPDLSSLIKGATAVRLPGRHLEAIYFDTADLRLARNEITLRYRSGEDGPPWTVKLPEGSPRAALLRREVSFDGTSAPVPPAAWTSSAIIKTPSSPRHGCVPPARLFLLHASPPGS
jgi:CYTH domain